MTCTIFHDSDHDEERRRRNIYRGDIYVFSPRPSSVALCEFARQIVEEAFAPHDPRLAQEKLEVEEFAAILAEMKPHFMHHARVKELIPAILGDFEADLERTYFDVPRMRTVPYGDYLSSGIAYAVPPHRDTWYAGSQAQLNWWLPLYEFGPEDSMVLYPRYMAEPMRNASNRYDHTKWVRKSRVEAAQHIAADTREHPLILDPIDPASELRLICPPGGLLLFSAAQLHSTGVNTSDRTRLSIDFRTFDAVDLQAGLGALNVDCEATGSTLGEYVNAANLSPPPDEVVTSGECRPLDARA